nr:DUF5906 domain-containing protein [uncultured Oscillibacter sp.]
MAHKLESLWSFGEQSQIMPSLARDNTEIFSYNDDIELNPYNIQCESSAELPSMQAIRLMLPTRTEAAELYSCVFEVSEGLPKQNILLEAPQTKRERYEPRNSLEELRRFAKKPQVPQEALLAQASAVLEKQELPYAISTLADIAASYLPLMVLDRVLYYRRGPIWEPIDKMGLFQELSNSPELSENGVMGGLNDRSITELFNKVLMKREITISSDDIKTKPHLIACTDGVYNVLTEQYGQPAADDYFFSNINVAAEEIGNGSGEIFEAFIDNISGGNSMVRQLFLEILGVMISNYMPKKFFLFLGVSDSGKSEAANLVRLILGENLVYSLADPNDLSNQWTFGSIQGKRLCYCPDAAKIPLSQPTIAAIKQLTGHDFLLGNRKYKDPFTFLNEAKILFVSNHPLCGPYDQALMSRLVVMPFRNAVSPEKQIPDLAQKLYLESGYIVGQAVGALRQLIRRNFVFTKVDDMESGYAAGGNRMNSYIEDFVENQCDLNLECVTSTQTLFLAYCAYCEEAGVQAISDAGVFGRMLLAAYPQLERTRNAGKNGLRGFVGICLKPQN